MRALRPSIAAVATALCVSGCAVGIAGTPSYVSGTGASINGKAFSNTGGSTEYWVRYGKTTDLGSETPHQSVDIDPEADERGVVVSTFLEGLDLATTYHYKLCAKDSQAGAGVGCDGDKTFTTEAQPRRSLVVIPYCVPDSAPTRSIYVRDESGFVKAYLQGHEGALSIIGAGQLHITSADVHGGPGPLDGATHTATATFDTLQHPPGPGTAGLLWEYQSNVSVPGELQIGNCDS